MKRGQKFQWSIGSMLSRLDEMPPFFIFYIAHRYGRRPTLSEMSSNAGIPVRTIARMSSKLFWKGTSVELIEPFFAACGVNLNNTVSLRDYIAHTLKCKRPFSHLSKDQLKRFNLRCARWKALREQEKQMESEK